MDPRKRRKSILPLIVLTIAAAWVVLPWQRWITPGPDSARNRPRNRTELARRLLERNRYGDVIRLGSQISPDATDAPEIYAMVGQAFLARGEVGNARKALEESLNRKLEQPEALEYLAAIYLASGDAVRGLALLELVARLKPADHRPWLAMGKVRHDMGETAEAAEAYENALEREPPSDEARTARLGLLRALVDANQLDKAGKLAFEFANLYPEDSEFLGLAANVAQATGQLEEAGRFVRNALKTDPEQPDALLASARIEFLEGDHAKAESLLTLADRKRPNQTAVLQLLMQAQAAQGKSAEAAGTKTRFQALTDRIARMDKLSKTISSSPDDPRPRYDLGMIALEGGMNVLAEQCFRAALDIDPNFSEARERLEEMRKSD